MNHNRPYEIVDTHNLLNSSIASTLAISSEATQIPAFTGTDADSTKGSLDSQRSSLLLVFVDFKIEVTPFIGKEHGDELE